VTQTLTEDDAVARPGLVDALTPLFERWAAGEPLTNEGIALILVGAGWVRPELMVAVGDLADMTGMSKSNVDRILKHAKVPAGLKRPESWPIRHGTLYHATAAMRYLEDYKAAQTGPGAGRPPGVHRSPLAERAIAARGGS
jgi:hypothetical protein